MSSIIWVLGIANEARPLIREFVKCLRAGKPDEAAKAAQRAIELHTFSEAQRIRVGKK